MPDRAPEGAWQLAGDEASCGYRAIRSIERAEMLLLRAHLLRGHLADATDMWGADYVSADDAAVY